MHKTTRHSILLGLALGVLPLLTPAGALAQDGGDGAPEVAQSMEFNDRARKLAIQLPQNWKPLKDQPSGPFVAGFHWPSANGKGSMAQVRLFVQTGFTRAELARYTLQRGVGELVEGSIRRGDGFSESCSINEKGGSAVFDRFVEKDGAVYHARFVCHGSNRERYTPIAHAALDSFTVNEPIASRELPDGWTEKKMKDLIVWTDSDEKDDLELAEVALPVWSVMKKALKGDAVDPLPPLVKVYRSAVTYEDDCKAVVGEARDHALYDHNNRALMIKYMGHNSTGFEWAAQQGAAAHYVSWYFGGTVPLWISRGLMIYGAVGGGESKGKPQKPPKDRLSRTRSIVARSTRLDKLLTAVSSDITDEKQSFDELWAWHWFFRHASHSRKYRKAYEKCLEVLHETGDVEAAHAAWEGTDFSDMHEAFKKWGKTLD